MAGLDGGWNLAIACVLVTACQRIEYVEEDDDPGAYLDSSGDADAPTDGAADESGDAVPMGTPVCLWSTWCSCYSDGQFCNYEEGIASCGWVEKCEGQGDEYRAWCLVDYFCHIGGTLEGDTVTCDDEPEECVGSCDLDPTLCDADGDGVPTFQCGFGSIECELDQYCVTFSELVSCDQDCSNCTESGGGVDCVDVPANCEGDTIEAERSCVREMYCDVPETSGNGRDVRCANEECHG